MLTCTQFINLLDAINSQYLMVLFAHFYIIIVIFLVI